MKKPPKFEFYVRAMFIYQVPVEILYYTINFQKMLLLLYWVCVRTSEKEPFSVCTTCITKHERLYSPEK